MPQVHSAWGRWPVMMPERMPTTSASPPTSSPELVERPNVEIVDVPAPLMMANLPGVPWGARSDRSSRSSGSPSPSLVTPATATVASSELTATPSFEQLRVQKAPDSDSGSETSSTDSPLTLSTAGSDHTVERPPSVPPPVCLIQAHSGGSDTDSSIGEAEPRASVRPRYSRVAVVTASEPHDFPPEMIRVSSPHTPPPEIYAGRPGPSPRRPIFMPGPAVPEELPPTVPSSVPPTEYKASSRIPPWRYTAHGTDLYASQDPSSKPPPSERLSSPASPRPEVSVQKIKSPEVPQEAPLSNPGSSHYLRYVPMSPYTPPSEPAPNFVSTIPPPERSPRIPPSMESHGPTAIVRMPSLSSLTSTSTTSPSEPRSSRSPSRSRSPPTPYVSRPSPFPVTLQVPPPIIMTRSRSSSRTCSRPPIIMRADTNSSRSLSRSPPAIFLPSRASGAAPEPASHGSRSRSVSRSRRGRSRTPTPHYRGPMPILVPSRSPTPSPPSAAARIRPPPPATAPNAGRARYELYLSPPVIRSPSPNAAVVPPSPIRVYDAPTRRRSRSVLRSTRCRSRSSSRSPRRSPPVSRERGGRRDRRSPSHSRSSPRSRERYSRRSRRQHTRTPSPEPSPAHRRYSRSPGRPYYDPHFLSPRAPPPPPRARGPPSFSPPRAPMPWSYPSGHFPGGMGQPFVHTPFKPHEKYYFSDANVNFEVGETIYRVHRYIFDQHSAVLNKMSSASVAYTFGVQTCTLDVEKDAWERVLSILYPSNMLDPGSEIRTVADWVSVLQVAKKLEMQQIQDLALKKIESSASAADKIAIAKDCGYHGETWLVPAFMELCMRTEDLTLDEGKQLGVQNMFRIQTMRKEMREKVKTMVEKDVLGK